MTDKSIDETAAERASHCQRGPACADDCCVPVTVPGHDAAWHAAARKAKLLSWISLGYMAAEGIVAVVASWLVS